MDWKTPWGTLYGTGGEGDRKKKPGRSGLGLRNSVGETIRRGGAKGKRGKKKGPKVCGVKRKLQGGKNQREVALMGGGRHRSGGGAH